MSAEPNLPQLLTVDQAAAYLQCHRVTILRAIRRGEIAALKIGNTYRVSVDEFQPTKAEKPIIVNEAPLSLYAQAIARRRNDSAANG